MNQTARYKLNQWDPTDRILREDFNADNAKLEAALAGLNTSQKTHANQLLGVPALGRNLYNLFLRQKNAGQDVSWMEGLVYDDFADQSKIESMGPGMSWSPTEKCIHFTPPDGQSPASLVTTVFAPPLPLPGCGTPSPSCSRWNTARRARIPGSSWKWRGRTLTGPPTSRGKGPSKRSIICPPTSETQSSSCVLRSPPSLPPPICPRSCMITA